MNQFNNTAKEFDNWYDTLCAKESSIVSVIERFIQKFEEQTDNLLAAKMEKSEKNLNLLSESFSNEVQKKLESIYDYFIDANMKEMKTVSTGMMDNKLEGFKVACEYEIEEYIKNDLMLTIVDNKYETDIKGKIQKQLLTYLHNGLTAQSYKDKVYKMVLKETQLSMESLKKESLKTLQDKFKMTISKLNNNMVSNIQNVMHQSDVSIELI